MPFCTFFYFATIVADASLRVMHTYAIYWSGQLFTIKLKWLLVLQSQLQNESRRLLKQTEML